MDRLVTIVWVTAALALLAVPIAVEAPMVNRCTLGALTILERADPLERRPPAWLVTAVNDAFTSSTLPMSVARMSMHNSKCNQPAKKTVRRMFETLGLSFWWSWRFSREDLVGLYVSQAWLGARPVGFAAASRRLFGRELDALSPEQQRCLMQKLQAPNAKKFKCGDDAKIVRR